MCKRESVFVCLCMCVCVRVFVHGYVQVHAQTRQHEVRIRNNEDSSLRHVAFSSVRLAAHTNRNVQTKAHARA